MPRRWVIILGAALCVVLVAWCAFFLYAKAQPIPQTILRQAGFGIWYPTARARGLQVDRDTIKYSQTGDDKLVTFTARTAGLDLAFTEQAQPESFTDVPQVYDKLIEKLHGYSSFDGVNGTVQLTRPDELGGRQTAVIKARGTLVFIKPSHNLETNQWRQIMNNLNFTH